MIFYLYAYDNNFTQMIHVDVVYHSTVNNDCFFKVFVFRVTADNSKGAELVFI